MYITPVENLILLKDSPLFWRRPNFVKVTDAFGQNSIEIYYAVQFGIEVPTNRYPFYTRGSIRKTFDTDSYFAGYHVLNTAVSIFSYPPTGVNLQYPIASIPGVIKEVRYITKEEFDLPSADFIKQNTLGISSLGGTLNANFG